MYNKIVGNCVVCKKQIKGEIINSLFTTALKEKTPLLCDECLKSKSKLDTYLVPGLIYRFPFHILTANQQECFGKIKPDYFYGHCYTSNGLKWIETFPITWLNYVNNNTEYVNSNTKLNLYADIVRIIHNNKSKPKIISMLAEQVSEVDGVITLHSDELMNTYPIDSTDIIRSALLSLLLYDYDPSFFTKLLSLDLINIKFIKFLEDLSKYYLPFTGITTELLNHILKQNNKGYIKATVKQNKTISAPQAPRSTYEYTNSINTVANESTSASSWGYTTSYTINTNNTES